MSLTVYLTVIALNNGFCGNILIFVISAVVTFACDMKTLIADLAINYFINMMPFSLLGSLCLSTFTKLTILTLFQGRCVILAVVRLISRVIKVKEKVMVAAVEAVNIPPE